MSEQDRVEYFKNEILSLSTQVVDLLDERDQLKAQVDQLREEKVQAARDGFIAGADSYFDRHSDEEMSEHVLNSAEKYANRLRQN